MSLEVHPKPIERCQTVVIAKIEKAIGNIKCGKNNICVISEWKAVEAL